MAGMLNENDPSDRAITSLTCSWVEVNKITEAIELHTNSYDCWGKFQAHQWHTTTAPYARIHKGLRSHITLELLKMG